MKKVAGQVKKMFAKARDKLDRQRPEPKFAVHPGKVRSVSDGEVHDIKSWQLAELYHLRKGEWVAWPTHGSHDGRPVSYDPDAYIHLYPDCQGRYARPDEDEVGPGEAIGDPGKDDADTKGLYFDTSGLDALAKSMKAAMVSASQFNHAVTETSDAMPPNPHTEVPVHVNARCIGDTIDARLGKIFWDRMKASEGDHLSWRKDHLHDGYEVTLDRRSPRPWENPTERMLITRRDIEQDMRYGSGKPEPSSALGIANQNVGAFKIRFEHSPALPARSYAMVGQGGDYFLGLDLAEPKKKKKSKKKGAK